MTMGTDPTTHSGAGNQEEIVVRVEALFEDMIPDYLEHKRAEILSIHSALEQEDFASLRKIGHEIEGAAGAFGFKGMEQIGLSLRLAAAEGDHQGVQRQAAELSDYLDGIRIEYE